jgi:alkyl sulfatase BDS1-like metallo-beta-lactamase superfamily hydrolase
MKTSELFEALREKAGAARPNLPAGFSAVALVNLTGPDPARWSLAAADGRLTLSEEAREEAGPDQADITITLAAETAEGLYLKTVNPLAAFMTGKVKVKGNPAKITLIKNFISGWLKG